MTSQYETNLWSTHVNIVRLAEPIRRCVRWRTQVFKIEGFVCKRFLPSLPPPPLSLFGSRFISRAVKTESPLPRYFFAPKPNGNACYAGYVTVNFIFTLREPNVYKPHQCFFNFGASSPLSFACVIVLFYRYLYFAVKSNKVTKLKLKFRAFSERCSVYIRSLCSANVSLKDCFWLTFFCC